MNPKIHLFTAIFIAVLLSSCEQDFVEPQNSINQNNVSLTEEFLPKTGLRPGYLDQEMITDQFCHSNTPAFLLPKVFVGESIQVHYVLNEMYSGAPAKPRGIEWQIGGETQLQLTTKLKIPYKTGFYQFDAIVTLEDGTKLLYKFDFNVTANLPIDLSSRCIEYDDGKDNFDPPAQIKESCPSQNGRIATLVIVDPVE